jgi:hypothetical protein
MTKVSCNGLIRFLVFAVVTAILSGILCAQVVPLTVSKVDPPNWQTVPSSNATLRLSGQHMDDVVRVATRHKGVRVVHIESIDANHLVVWLRISSGAEPGAMILQVSTRNMTTFVAVPMSEQNAASPSADQMTAGK